MVDLYQQHSLPLTATKMTVNAEPSNTNAAHASVLTPSEAIPEDAMHIKGPDLNNAITLQDLLESYEKIGFQATGLAKAIKIIENMVCRLRNSPHGVLTFRCFERGEHAAIQKNR